MWQTLTVNMNDLSISRSPFNEEFGYLGGRALVADYMLKKVPPTCDALGEDNRLIFCLGILAGSNMSTAHRLSVGAKSPLTGGIKESNAGGYAATLLAQQGYKLIEVLGLPAEGLHILHIDAKGEAGLLDASEYHLMNNYDFVDKMLERFGDSIATISIGSGGERQYKAAGIQLSEYGDNHPSRIAARGGLGAVMGSKGLKAIVIEKPELAFTPPIADEEAFKENCRALNKMIGTNAKNDPFSNIGTVSTIEVTSKNGILPVRNFSGEYFADADRVGAGQFMTNLAQHGGGNKKGCQPGCLVQCSNVYNAADGTYLTSGFEYETIALFGPNCDISDLDAIAQMDRLCDEVGVDTIDISTAIGVCMDMGKIPWGDIDATLALLTEMAEGTGFGVTLGDGCEAVGLALGSNRIPVVKHQALAAYDPRNTKGTGVTYSTSPMGADHTAGLTMGRAFDDAGRAGQAYASNKLQVAMCSADSMMCIFAFSNCVPGVPLITNMISAMYDVPFAPLDFLTLGTKCLMSEKQFNTLAGMSAKEDRLPGFFYKERSSVTGAAFDLIDKELDAVFEF